MEKKERNYNSYCELPEGEEMAPSTSTSPTPSPAKRRESRKGKEIRILRKAKSIRERTDPALFAGEGLNFRAKIIGTENVFDARGNRMCQGALQRLKAAAKSSGDHKQKIILNVSLEGIIIKDEKAGDVLHHHPIHKISFISQDIKDSRTFGYVYGCPQTGHQFFAIKTEKAASHVVFTLRDLFLSALDMKKAEIARNNAEQTPEDDADRTDSPPRVQNKHTNGVSNGSVEMPSAPFLENGGQSHLYSNTVLLPEESVCEPRVSDTGGALHSLVDLQSEVDNLQQGISQMDHSIAASLSQNLGISVSEEDVSIPNAFHFKLEKLASLYQETLSISSRSSSTSDYNVGAAEVKVEENETPKKDPPASVPPEACSSGISSLSIGSNSSVSEEANESVVEDRYAVFLNIDSMPSIFDDPSIVQIPSEKVDLPNIDSKESESEAPVIKSSTPIGFAELDPLGNQPYVDRRDFFQDIKNPPKKVLKDLGGDFCPDAQPGIQESFVSDDSQIETQESTPTLQEISSSAVLPPKLPPKRSANTLSSEIQQNSKDSAVWEPKNPFNPFLCEEYPDVPPPSSPPPPPPPRLPTKVSDSSPTLSPPPPRPPSRVSDIPTPPLPKRKVPLSSTNRTWFSFDQDIPLFPPTSTVEVVGPGANNAPPLPSPARKLPPPKLTESPLLKTTSLSNSPATLRKMYNRSPRLGSSAITNEISDPKISSTTDLPKKALSCHSSTLHENDTLPSSESEIEDPKVCFVVNSAPQNSSIMDPFSSGPFSLPKEALLEKTVENSPPLPPKPASIFRSRPSPLKRGISVSSCSSAGASVIESSSGTTHSSSSLVFSSLDENRIGSSSEALFTNSTDSSSDVFPSSNKERAVHPPTSTDIPPTKETSDIVSEKNSEETTQLQSSNGCLEEQPANISPDSIFRRKSDPFADDFFLSLRKKSNCDSLLIVKSSIGVEEHFDNIKAPT